MFLSISLYDVCLDAFAQFPRHRAETFQLSLGLPGTGRTKYIHNGEIGNKGLFTSKKRKIGMYFHTFQDTEMKLRR